MRFRAASVILALVASSGVPEIASSVENDIAPIPPSVVYHVLNRATGTPGLGGGQRTGERIERVLSQAGAEFDKQARRRNRNAARITEGMLASAAGRQLRTLRAAYQQAAIPPRAASAANSARAKALTVLDTVIADFDALTQATGLSRESARTRLQALFARIQERRKAAEQASMRLRPDQPMLASAPPPPPVELPRAEGKPAYLTDAQMERAMRQYAFNGDVLLLAAAPDTPTEAQSCDYMPADLAADGQDVQLTTEIIDLADSLAYSPTRIFEYVANQIEFEPYYGALKGATGTLDTHAGGVTDKASLLIALLRASNIPARYVRGRIFVNDDTAPTVDQRVNKWLEVKDLRAAAQRLAQGGNPEAQSFIDGSGIGTQIKWSHVWVEACVPYAHYRGAAIDNAGHRWIALDPSFETRRYRAEAEVTGAFDFDDYLDGLSTDLPHERFETQGADELATSDLALNEAGYTSTKEPLVLDILPASLPYAVESFTAWPGSSSSETAVLPADHRYVLDIEVEDNGGADLLSPQSVDFVDVSLSRLTIGFEGATAGDDTALVEWRDDPDPDAAVPCSINVKPVMRQDGAIVASGSGSQGICVTDSTPNQIKLKVRLPERTAEPVITGCGPALNDFCTFDGIRAADIYAVGAYAWQTKRSVIAERVGALADLVNTTPSLSGSTDAIVGEFLHIVGWKYLHYVADASRRVGQLIGATGDLAISLGLTSTTSKVERVLDQPLGIVRNGMLVDFPGVRAASIDLATGDRDFDRFVLVGYAGSALESFVWGENARLDAVSTVRGIQFGNEDPAQTGMLTLTQGTGTAGLVCESAGAGCSTIDANYGYSASFRAGLLTNYLNQAYEVKIPKRRLQYNDWKGHVFVATRNDSGNFTASFPIAGGYQGGYTTGTPLDFSYNATTGTGYRNAGTGGGGGGGGTATTPTFVDNGVIGNGNSPYNTLGGDPVNLVTGNLYHAERDLVIPARDLPFVLERTYNKLDAVDGPFGFGWTHSFQHSLRFLDEPPDGSATDGMTSTLEWMDGTGARRRIGVSGANGSGVPVSATFTRPSGFFFTVTRTASAYEIREKNGVVYTFQGIAGTVGQVAKLTKITSPNGNTLTLAYDGSFDKLLTVQDDNSRTLTFTYTGNHITRVEDFTGRRQEYVYDGNGDLREFKNPLALAGDQDPVTYEYYTVADGDKLAHAMKHYTLPAGNGMAFEYYVDGRVFRHTNTKGEKTTFSYDDYRRETIVTDPRDYDKRYLFDSYGNSVQITEADGTIWRYAYDSAVDPHLRTRVTNPYGHQTQMAYDAQGNLTIVTNPSGSTVEMSEYTSFGEPGKVKDANGNYRLFKYDGNGNLTDEWVMRAGVGAALDPQTYTPNASDLLAYAHHTYDAGNRTSTKRIRDIANDRGLTLTWSYSAAKLYPNHLSRCGDKDGDGEVHDDTCDESDLVYDALGRLESGVNGRFETVNYEYDAVDRIIEGTDGIGEQRTYSYDKNGNPTGSKLIVPVNGTPTLVDSQAFEYDGSDRRVTSIDAGGGVSRMEYDPAGNLESVLDPDGFTVGFTYDPLGRVLSALDQEDRKAYRTLDGLGRIKNLVDPNDNAQTYVYYGAAKDSRLEKTCDALNRCTTLDYDANGNVTSITDNDGNATLTQYDALNRPVRIVQPAYMDAVLAASVHPVTCYSYDLLGNLSAVVAGYTANPGGTCAADASTLSPQSAYVYDDRGNRLSATDALARTTTYVYDIHDNLKDVAFPRGNHIERDYAYGGLLIAERAYAPGGALESTHGYLRNHLGQVTQTTGPAVNYTYSYDDAHRINGVTDSRGGKTLTYQWSSGGLLDHLVGPDGKKTDYGYDPVGRLRFVFAPDSETIEYRYDKGGRVTGLHQPGGIETRYTYKADDTLESLTTTSPDGAVFSADYTYDSLGRRDTITESLSGLPGRSQTLSYDALSRLASVLEAGVTQSFTYDPFGNRRTYDDGAGTVRYYAYDAAHQLDDVRTGSAGGPVEADYGYDQNGNLIGRDAAGTADDWAYDYDARENMVQAAKTGFVEAYAYDDTGRRIAKTTNGARTDYLYDGLTIYEEVEGDWNAPAARLTHGAGTDTPLLRTAGATSVSFHQDGIGSVVAASSGLATRNNVAAGNSVNRTAGSTYSGGYGFLKLTDGDRRGVNPTSGGLYVGTSNSTFELDFGSAQQVSQVELFTANGFWNAVPLEPNPDLTVTSNVDTKGVSVDYWDGGAWVNLGSVTGNDKVQVTFTFAAVTTTKLRIVLTDADNVVTLTEVEAINPAGGTLATQRFDAWGNKTAGSGAIPLYGYTGREADASGFTFMRARYYDPEVGRFTQQDPLGMIEGVNAYAYALNNPINRVDPLGTVSQAFSGTNPSYGGATPPGGLSSGQQSLGSTVAAAAGEFALGFIPGYDLYQAFQNPDATGFDYLIGVLGVAPGLGKAVGTGLKGGRAVVNAVDTANDLRKVARGDDFVDLYRAVGPDELADIQKSGVFRSPAGIEGKYFTTSGEQASTYAREAVRAFGDDPYTIVRTQVPRSALDTPGISATVEKGINAIQLPNRSLPGLSPEVLNASPIP